MGTTVSTFEKEQLEKDNQKLCYQINSNDRKYNNYFLEYHKVEDYRWDSVLKNVTQFDDPSVISQHFGYAEWYKDKYFYNVVNDEYLKHQFSIYYRKIIQAVCKDFALKKVVYMVITDNICKDFVHFNLLDLPLTMNNIEVTEKPSNVANDKIMEIDFIFKIPNDILKHNQNGLIDDMIADIKDGYHYRKWNICSTTVPHCQNIDFRLIKALNLIYNKILELEADYRLAKTKGKKVAMKRIKNNLENHKFWEDKFNEFYYNKDHNLDKMLNYPKWINYSQSNNL